MFRTIVLMRKRGKLTKELNDRDLKNFNDITEYMEMSSLRAIEREEVYQQILDMILKAKSEGKFASEVIGHDIKGFCDSIIKESNYNKSIFHICFNYIEAISQAGLLYFLMMFITNLISNGWNISIKNQDMLYIELVTFVAMSAVILPLSFMIRRNHIFRKKKSKISYSFISMCIFLYLYMSVTDMIKIKFPQLSTSHIIPHGNEIFLLIIFLIAFGRDIFYHIKSISKKF